MALQKEQNTGLGGMPYKVYGGECIEMIKIEERVDQKNQRTLLHREWV